MTLEEFQEHSDSNDGYCKTCKEVTANGGIEPDAREYECPDCKELTLYGVEEALLQGLIELD